MTLQTHTLRLRDRKETMWKMGKDKRSQFTERETQSDAGRRGDY